MPNQVTLTFGGDADQLVKEAARAQRATDQVGDSAGQAGQDFDTAAGQSRDFTSRIGALGAATEGASTAIGDAAGFMQALADAETFGERRAQELARANNDLAQAQADVNQAAIDGRQAVLDVAQAEIDAKQAVLDAETATKEYNEAVKEHGKNSAEARQAAIDLEQAHADSAQAIEDVAQANADAEQATIDATDAQLNANDAMMAANPPELQKWADQLNVIAPLLQGVVGIIALVTAAQWAWNVAMTANPIGLIIVGVGLLIAGIVLIATKTTWFQTLWKKSWDSIKWTAEAVWNWMKKIPGWTETAFSKIATVVVWPYKTAFNAIASAWNNTVGRLHWTVPSWVPGIGGNSISVPNIPRFHSGGRVPGGPGQEMLAILEGGETVLPTQGGGAAVVIELHSDGTAAGDAVIELVARGMRVRGGDPGALGIQIRKAS